MSEEELEELEELFEEPDYGEVPAAAGGNDDICSCRQFLSSPESGPVLSLMQNYRFPSILVSRNLQIVWENDEYHAIFGESRRELPVSLAKDFSPDLDAEKSSLLYRALGSSENGFSCRVRLQSIRPNRRTVATNAHFTPVFPTAGEIPCCYQVFFDIVTEEEKSLLQHTFLSLLEASKLKDNDTGSHISRVGEYSKRLSKELYKKQNGNGQGYGEVTIEFIHNIQFLAPMHDVGKIGTPDDILNKNGPLDEREWEIMKEHTINGAYIMNTYPDIMAKQIALHHHERWDGSGYPYQIQGEMIPLAARIVSIADVYDALRMQRSYKEPFSHEKSLSVMCDGRERQFDPVLLDTFFAVSDDIIAIFEELKDEEA
jgi:hypothetical protein